MSRFQVALKPGGIEPLKWNTRRTCIDGDDTLTAYYSKDDDLILLHVLTQVGTATVEEVFSSATSAQEHCLTGAGTIDPVPSITTDDTDSIYQILCTLLNEQKLTNQYLSSILGDVLED